MARQRIVVTFALFSALIGCGGSGGSTISPGYTPQKRVADAANGKTWMSPDAKTTANLLYVSDAGANDVNVYSYPKGVLMGTLTGFEQPAGECVDTSGDVWITSGSEIIEYAHGETSPIATLHDLEQYPHSCSVDPTTGDLAAANIPVGSEPGSVSIFRHSQGMPTIHFDDNFAEMFYLSYDNKGDVFVDGIGDASQTRYAELPRGKPFRELALRVNFWPGGVAWDGRYVAVGDQQPPGGGGLIYRTSGAKVIESVKLSGPENADVAQFFITQNPLQKRVVCPESGAGAVTIYSFPSGGSPIRTITGLVAPAGVVVSRL